MVNTFLPYANFETSAKTLDYRRLGKQRVEALQILRANLGLTVGWVNHPAAKMWKGHEITLVRYGIAMCNEWRDRGFKDSCLDKFNDLLIEAVNQLRGPESDVSLSGAQLVANYGEEIPAWLGNKYFHRSHQSNLLRKDWSYYSKYNWDVPNNLDYIWPDPGPIKVRGGNIDSTLYVQPLEEWELELLGELEDGRTH